MKKLGLLLALGFSLVVVGCGKKAESDDPALQPLDPKKGRETLPSAGMGGDAPPPQKAASQKISGQ